MGKSKVIFVKYEDDTSPLDIDIERDAVTGKPKGKKPKESRALGESNAFTRFQEMVQSLTDVISDDAMRYLAALKAVGKSYGITATQIVSEVEAKLESLKTEKEQYAEKLDESKRELESFNRKLRERDQAIESMKRQLDSLLTDKKVIETAIVEKQKSLAGMKKGDLSDLETRYGELELQRQELLKYFKKAKS